MGEFADFTLPESRKILQLLYPMQKNFYSLNKPICYFVKGGHDFLGIDLLLLV